MSIPRSFRRHIAPLSFFGTMGIGIWYYIYSRSVNSQLVGSTFFKGVLFAVQNDPRAIELLGSNIRFDPAVAPAKGFANTLKGRAEMTFPIVGNNDIVATVNFKGTQLKDIVTSEVFTVTTKEGVVVDLH